MMRHLLNGVRSHGGVPRTAARVHGDGSFVISCVALALLGIVSWIATISMLRSARTVFGDMVLGWPWW